MVLDGKSSQECPVSAGVLLGSILDPALFLLYINDLPGDVLCNIAIYADDATLYSKLDQTSDLWFWTWIWSTRHWAGKGSGLLISVLEKLVSFDWCYGCEKGWIFGKIMLYRRCWGWLSLLNRIRALTLPLLRKLPRRKLEPRFVLLSFFLLKLLRISINLTDGHAWNNVVMSGERLLVAN